MIPESPFSPPPRPSRLLALADIFQSLASLSRAAASLMAAYHDLRKR